MASKKEIREQILKKRQALSLEEWKEKSLTIAKQIFLHPAFREETYIFAYLPIRGEVNTLPVLEEAWRQGKKTAVPKVISETEMEFYEITSLADLSPGKFGILEPVTEKRAETKKALILMPGAAFDRSCARIGYGGGYYDRYLKKHPQMHTAALAFDLQLVEEITAESHDIKPEYLVTETECLCQKGEECK